MKVRITYGFALSVLGVAALQSSAQPAARNKDAFASAEKKLQILAQDILYGADDSAKYQSCRLFSAGLRELLEREGSFFYPFDTLKSIARLVPADKAFRLFNWNLPRSDGTFEYFGMVQTYDRKTRTSKLYELHDASADIRDPENAVLHHGRWYGAHYYTIIPEKKRKSTYYTLLGWDGNDRVTTRKVVDVLYLENDTVRFGAPILGAEGGGFRHRLIFEYTAQAVMSMIYYPRTRIIIYDHLSPSKPQLQGQYRHYGPDMSYDALRLKRGKWIYKADVDARNAARDVDPSQRKRIKAAKEAEKGLFDGTEERK